MDEPWYDGVRSKMLEANGAYDSDEKILEGGLERVVDDIAADITATQKPVQKKVQKSRSLF